MRKLSNQVDIGYPPASEVSKDVANLIQYGHVNKDLKYNCRYPIEGKQMDSEICSFIVVGCGGAV